MLTLQVLRNASSVPSLELSWGRSAEVENIQKSREYSHPAHPAGPPRSATQGLCPLPPPTMSISLQKRLWEQDGFSLCVLICLLAYFLAQIECIRGQEVGGWLGQVSKEQPGPACWLLSSRKVGVTSCEFSLGPVRTDTQRLLPH